MRPWLCLLLSLSLLVPLQNWLDAQPRPTVPLDETLYLQSGRALKSFSLGFNALLADLYWLRTIQYFGGKLEAASAGGREVSLASVGTLRLESLPTLLNIVTELDPGYLAAYRFGASFLPAASAVALVERGLRENPGEWRLYLDLGYLRWQQKQFAAAQSAFERGSRVAGAPEWLKVLAATMAAKGNDRTTAREIFRRLYENTGDAYTREVSALRLLALEALDEVDALNARLAEAQQRGNCPAPDKLLAEVRRRQPPSPALAAFGGTTFPYAYDRAACRVALPSDSPLARWAGAMTDH
jgi:tetratricopeptide (TPR) repeat protein